MRKDELSDSKGYGCLSLCAWAESLIKHVNCKPLYIWTPYLVEEQPTDLLGISFILTPLGLLATHSVG